MIMTPQPKSLRMADPSTLEIEWSDGIAMQYPAAELRAKCPCATCRSEPPPEGAADERPPSHVTIEAVTPVGNYAYGIHFSDGHDTGIFTLALLRELGRS